MFLLLFFLLSTIHSVDSRKGRNYLSANSFDAKAAHRRSAVRIGKWCSGTLISPTLVYTAAHCLAKIGKIDKGLIYVTSEMDTDNTAIRYSAKQTYVPQLYLEAEVRVNNDVEFKKRMGKCDLNDCRTCSSSDMELYKNFGKYDYGLIELSHPFPMCVNSNDAVPAELYPYAIRRINGNECFMVGYGYTDMGKPSSPTLAKIDSFDSTSSNYCGYSAPSYHVRFLNSSRFNQFRTDVCKGDSGSGMQCVLNQGTRLVVNSAASRAVPEVPSGRRDLSQTEKCRELHKSLSIAVEDHYDDLMNVIKKWNVYEEYLAAHKPNGKCSIHLKYFPFPPLAETYPST